MHFSLGQTPHHDSLIRQCGEDNGYAVYTHTGMGVHYLCADGEIIGIFSDYGCAEAAWKYCVEG